MDNTIEEVHKTGSHLSLEERGRAPKYTAKRGQKAYEEHHKNSITPCYKQAYMNADF
mgnify:CR=1 FL=1